jgi:hypothetical protein
MSYNQRAITAMRIDMLIMRSRDLPLPDRPVLEYHYILASLFGGKHRNNDGLRITRVRQNCFNRQVSFI